MNTALPQKFPFILDRNLVKANCTENRVCTSCDTVVLGTYFYNSKKRLYFRTRNCQSHCSALYVAPCCFMPCQHIVPSLHANSLPKTTCVTSEQPTRLFLEKNCIAILLASKSVNLFRNMHSHCGVRYCLFIISRTKLFIYIINVNNYYEMYTIETYLLVFFSITHLSWVVYRCLQQLRDIYSF